MTNCPNCGAPLEIYQWRCPYCGTYYFDLDAWDLEDGKPTFVKFKTSQGTITALAKPTMGEITVSSDSIYYSDTLGNPITSFCTSKTCDININFSCCENPNNKTLFQIKRNE